MVWYSVLQRAESRIVDEATQIVGRNGAQTLKMLIDNAHKQSTGIIASVVAIVMLLFGASSLFTELHDSLNTIWDAPPRKSSNAIKGMLWQRLTSFGMVVGVGILLLASLVASAGLAIVEKFFGGMVPFSATLFEVLNIAVTSVMVAVLFALIFKFVPDVRIDWEDVGIGAVVTVCAISNWEVAAGSISDYRRRGVHLWGGRIGSCPGGLGLLFGTDFPVWGHVHACLCLRLWLPPQERSP